MKIEKISNSQIRCILTGEDLASRQLRLSELAYGSEKARALFRDMMEQAAIQCGFDAENYPLMIEAIPLGADSIVLIVTKVDNPEELDTRFSNFAPSVQKDAAPAKEPPSPLSQLLKSMKENASDEGSSARASRSSENKKSAEEVLKEKREQLLTTRLYSFDTMADAILAAKVLYTAYTGSSSLYRDEKSGRFRIRAARESQPRPAAVSAHSLHSCLRRQRSADSRTALISRTKGRTPQALPRGVRPFILLTPFSHLFILLSLHLHKYCETFTIVRNT